MNDSEECKVELKKIRQAVSAVYKLLELKHKTPLENEHSNLILEITLKKAVGTWNSLKVIKFRLPHPYVNDSNDVTLIVKDLDPKAKQPDDESTIDFYENILRDSKITCINKVVPIHQLKVEHLLTEEKSQFMYLHDVLLVDSRVKGLLPLILGKSLFRKKRLGKSVNVKASKIKTSITRALYFSELHVTGYGLCCSIQIGSSFQGKNEIIQNICAVEQRLRNILPGGILNVRQINLRSHNTMSIPIYIHLGSRNDVILPGPVKEETEDEAEEVDTVIGGKVKVHKDFKVEILKDKDMDSDMDEEDIKRDKLACSNPMFKARRLKKAVMKKTMKKKPAVKSMKKKTLKKADV